MVLFFVFFFYISANNLICAQGVRLSLDFVASTKPMPNIKVVLTVEVAECSVTFISTMGISSVFTIVWKMNTGEKDK